MGGNAIDIGTAVTYGGRRYVLRGYSRLSLVNRHYVYLEDAETGEWMTVLFDEVEPAPVEDGA